MNLELLALHDKVKDDDTHSLVTFFPTTSAFPLQMLLFLDAQLLAWIPELTILTHDEVPTKNHADHPTDLLRRTELVLKPSRDACLDSRSHIVVCLCENKTIVPCFIQ